MRNLLLIMLFLSGPAFSQEANLENGHEVWDKWCVHCHHSDPRKHPGTRALEFLYKGEKPAGLEDRVDLTPEIVTFYVRNGVSIMPFFRKTEISEQDLIDLGAYLSPNN